MSCFMSHRKSEILSGACLEPTQASYEVNLQPSGGEATIEQGEAGLSLASLTLPSS